MDMNVSIIGAGPVGLLAALYTHSHFKSARIRVFERRLREEMTGSHGRSINLALSERGLRALDGIAGLKDEILSGAVAMRGRSIHELNSTAGELKIPYGRDVIYSVERDWIEEILLKRVEEVGCEIEFNKQAVDFVDGSLIFSDDSGPTAAAAADLVLACDGAFSKLRTALLKRQPGRLIQEHFSHQYRELSIPATAAGKYALDPNWLHIWPRDDFMLIALPNQDGSFTATLFYDRFDELEATDSSPPLISSFFCANFPTFLAALPPTLATNSLLSDFKVNPRGDLFTVSVSPLAFAGKCVLLGDAGHAILPFYGQGLNAGFEDVRLLFECFQSQQFLQSLQHGSAQQQVSAQQSLHGSAHAHLAAALQSYSNARIPDAAAIDLLARLNYREMRQQVRRRWFRAKCSVFLVLERLLPGLLLSRYTMIAFTSIPYAKILVRERVQVVLLVVIAVSICSCFILFIL